MKKTWLFLGVGLLVMIMIGGMFVEAGWRSDLPKTVIKTVQRLRPYYDQFNQEYFERYNRTILQDAKNLSLKNATLVGNLAIVEYTLDGEYQTMITTIK